MSLTKGLVALLCSVGACASPSARPNDDRSVDVLKQEIWELTQERFWLTQELAELKHQRQRPVGEVTRVITSDGQVFVEFAIKEGSEPFETGDAYMMIRGLRTLTGTFRVSVASATRGKGVVDEMGEEFSPRAGGGS